MEKKITMGNGSSNLALDLKFDENSKAHSYVGVNKFGTLELIVDLSYITDRSGIKDSKLKTRINNVEAELLMSKNKRIPKSKQGKILKNEKTDYMDELISSSWDKNDIITYKVLEDFTLKLRTNLKLKDIYLISVKLDKGNRLTYRYDKTDEDIDRIIFMNCSDYKSERYATDFKLEKMGHFRNNKLTTSQN